MTSTLVLDQTGTTSLPPSSPPTPPSPGEPPTTVEPPAVGAGPMSGADPAPAPDGAPSTTDEAPPPVGSVIALPGSPAPDAAAPGLPPDGSPSCVRAVVPPQPTSSATSDHHRACANALCMCLPSGQIATVVPGRIHRYFSAVGAGWRNLGHASGSVPRGVHRRAVPRRTRAACRRRGNLPSGGQAGPERATAAPSAANDFRRRLPISR